MGLFKRNKNEEAYVGGKKHFADVIKNTGANEYLIWRQPEEDFNTNSTLIVMPGEQAVFIKGGLIEQVFDNGTYQLSTENYPFISRLRNAFTGGVSTFNCVIYFIKKSISIEIGWGTSSPIQLRDKKLGITTKLKANGAYKVQVTNYGKFLEKLIGNNVTAMMPSDLNNYFFNEFQGKIRDVIAKAIQNSDEEILGIDARLEEISNLVKPHLQSVFDEYGIKCINFSIAEIIIDDDQLRVRYDTRAIETYEQLQQGDVDAQNTIKLGQAEAQVKLQQGLVDAQLMVAQGKAQKEVMEALGDAGWSRQQAAEILKSLAENPGSGSLAATGAGFGMGMAMTGPFANLANQMIAPLTDMNVQTNEQPVSASSRFEEETEEQDPVEVLSKLKKLLDADLITKEEYDQKKKEILSRM